MSFESPVYLALLLLAPAAALAYASLARWRREAARRFAPGRPAAGVGSASSAMRAFKAGLVVLAVALIAVALAGPRIGEAHVVVEQEGADVVVVLDVSRSMLATDVEPTRLASAIVQTTLLVERLRSHRVGLVIFAGTALVRSPLTTDTAPLQAFVGEIDEGSRLVEPGSDLGAGLRAGMRVLQGSETKSRVIVLLSDGEDHEGDALAAAEAAAAQGILLYSAGFGTLAGAAVPDEDAIEGVPVVTRLNERLLRRITTVSVAGRYAAGREATELANDINALKRSTFASERQLLPIERFQWIALIALALLAAEILLPERGFSLGSLRRVSLPGGVLGAMGLLLVLGAACSSAADDFIVEGNAAYDRGEYEDALEAFRRAGAHEPNRSEAHYNAGLALHQLEEYDLATAATVRSLPIEDPADAASAYYNLGSHYALLGQLEDALSAYRQSLLLNPADADAKYNLELVRQLMIQRVTEEGVPGEEEQRVDDGEDDSSGEASVGLENRQEALSLAFQAALLDAGEELTVAEALRALELAQELNSILPLTDQVEQPRSSDSPDY